jgi:hypothetical protein
VVTRVFLEEEGGRAEAGGGRDAPGEGSGEEGDGNEDVVEGLPAIAVAVGAGEEAVGGEVVEGLGRVRGCVGGAAAGRGGAQETMGRGAGAAVEVAHEDDGGMGRGAMEGVYEAAGDGGGIDAFLLAGAFAADHGGEVADEEVERVRVTEEALAVEDVAGGGRAAGVDGKEGRGKGTEKGTAIEEGDVDAPRVGGIGVDDAVVPVGERRFVREVDENPAVFYLGETDEERQRVSPGGKDGAGKVAELAVVSFPGPVARTGGGKLLVTGVGVVAGVEEVLDVVKDDAVGRFLRPRRSGEE